MKKFTVSSSKQELIQEIERLHRELELARIENSQLVVRLWQDSQHYANHSIIFEKKVEELFYNTPFDNSDAVSNMAAELINVAGNWHNIDVKTTEDDVKNHLSL